MQPLPRPEVIAELERLARPKGSAAKALPTWVLNDLVKHRQLLWGLSPESRCILQVARCPGFSRRMWSEYAKAERVRRVKKPMPSLALLSPLANFLARATQFTDEARLPARERSRMGGELASRAKDLRATLVRMADAEQYPEWRSHYSGGPYAAETLLRLEEIERAAEAWTVAKTQVYRPTDSTSRRTYFVHSLARSFTRRYGSPHAGLIAQLSDVFFPGAALDRRRIERLLKAS